MRFCEALHAWGLLWSSSAAGEFDWRLPERFSSPAVPEDNPMSSSKVELGRRLFYDVRLSVNQRQSCASCHRQELAFTDGKARAEGTTGELHPRGSMSLANVAYAGTLTWANPMLASLEEQMLLPLYGTEPSELGMKGQENRFLAQARIDSVYQSLFPKAFPDDGSPYRMENVVRAIAAFERTLISIGSPYDRYRHGGEPEAISEAAKRGEVLFFSGEKTACFQCHGGWNFGGGTRVSTETPSNPRFHNTGLYDPYPAPNTGLAAHTGSAADAGKFRAPTLRNIAVTAPYMHDGSIASLEGVLDHYAAGGRTGNPQKSPILRKLTLSAEEKQDLIAFLVSLTDEAFLNDPRFGDPWR